MIASVYVPNGIDPPELGGLVGSSMKWKNNGWFPVYGIVEITGTKSGNSGTAIALRAYEDRSFYVWKPWYRVIDASLGLNKATVLRWLNSIGAPPAVPSGTIALHDHQVFRTGANTTANLPTASAVGEGAQFFDTTTNKPIWSDGTTWYDAMGTLSGSATYDPAELADGVGATTTVTVTGAALGDFAEASFSNDLQGISLTAWVSAADTVSVRFQNESGGTLDLASGTLRAQVRKA